MSRQSKRVCFASFVIVSAFILAAPTLERVGLLPRLDCWHHGRPLAISTELAGGTVLTFRAQPITPSHSAAPAPDSERALAWLAVLHQKLDNGCHGPYIRLNRDGDIEVLTTTTDPDHIERLKELVAEAMRAPAL